MTLFQKERIALLRGVGKSYAVISADLDVPENTIKSYCRRNNLGADYKAGQSTPDMDNCINCGKPLKHTRGAKRKKFCSDKCRMVWWNANPGAVNRKAVYQFKCAVCGTGFESYGDADRKYCSRGCYGLARRTSDE